MAPSSSTSHRPVPVLPCLAVECSTCSSSRRCTVKFFSAVEKKPVGGGATGLSSELLGVKAVVCATPLGWILVRESAGGSTYMLDPRQDKKIQLPPLAGIEDDVLVYSNCLLSDQPTSPAGCIVLVVEPLETVIWHHHMGTSVWIRHEYDIGIQGDEHHPDKIHIVPIATCHGKFYFNSCCFNEISVLEFCPGPQFSSIKLDGAGLRDSSGKGGIHVFLLESDGELCMVRLQTVLPPASSLQVHVYRMDFSQQRWCLVNDLGDRAFFVAPFYFGASCLAGEYGIQKNCVYSVRYWRDRAFTISNMEDGSSHVHSLHEAESICRTSWMLPTDPKG
uniref:KIB1-4 beta-propeller domain-containing protein n=1 Tax=Leersia perrieri TaxID=77586 RepID=A0A0D9V1Q5_9ORYZ